MQPKRILLASHGTLGAMAAETVALETCDRGGLLYQLLIVPDFWKGMMATDWRNQSVARNEFARHLESELEKEIREHRDRVRRGAQTRGIDYDFALAQGDPAELLLEFVSTHEIELVVAGAPRPRGTLGFRSRMLTDRVLRSLTVPLLMVPRPHD